jgi:hypothetical protein
MTSGFYWEGVNRRQFVTYNSFGVKCQFKWTKSEISCDEYNSITEAEFSGAQ